MRRRPTDHYKHYTLDSPTRRHLWALAAVIVLGFAACGSDPSDRLDGRSQSNPMAMTRR